MIILRDLISSTKKILTLEAAGKTFGREWFRQRLYHTYIYKAINRLNLENYFYDKEWYLMEQYRLDTRKIQRKSNVLFC